MERKYGHTTPYSLLTHCRLGGYGTTATWPSRILSVSMILSPVSLIEYLVYKRNYDDYWEKKKLHILCSFFSSLNLILSFP
jgi:hypothetical protein